MALSPEYRLDVPFRDHETIRHYIESKCLVIGCTCASGVPVGLENGRVAFCQQHLAALTTFPSPD